jgi:predicted enzyme related to lactoylglutathione lyase
MAIKSVGLSWVGVSDMKKAKSFFVDTLGLKVFEEQPEYGWLEVKGAQGNQTVGIGRENKEAQMPAGINAVVTLVPDNYDQTKQELAEKGIKFFGEIAGFPDVPRMVCFKDPDGNLFQLVEESVKNVDKK